MKLGELLHLVPLLEKADPEDIIIINPGSKTFLLINPRPGLHQPISDPSILELTAADEEFLRALSIPI